MWERELPDRQLIFEAIRGEDLGQVVLTTLNILEQNNLISPPIHVPTKSQSFSEQCRSEGNIAYKQGKHQKALEFYNKALLYAPKNSQALALAYSNRSALLFTVKLYKQCLTDINVSLGMGCAPHVVTKLKKRKTEAEAFLWKENLVHHIRDTFVKGIFDFNAPKHAQIPCASLDIDVQDTDSGIPQVVAACNVKVGAVLAIEKAFFSAVEEDYKYTACFYCQNVNPNLIPCDGCVEALFCNETCKKRCMAEYHSIECKLAIRNDMMPFVQAAIKLKNSFISWKEFIAASHLLGLDRIKKSEIDQIYNGENKYSMLNFHHDRHFLHGRIYNFSLKFARIISGLLETNTFFPKDREERLSAILAFSRVLMYMSLHIPYMDVMSCVSVLVQNTNELLNTGLGMFPLLGKLPHSCDPNTLMVGLNNRIALLAIKPLKPGTKLTVSYAGHRLDYTTLLRQDNLLVRYGVCCVCDLCRGIPWKTYTKPTESQMRIYNKLDPKSAVENLDFEHIQHMFNKSAKTLAFLSDLPFSQEYRDVYVLFRKCLLHIQDCVTANHILGTKK